MTALDSRQWTRFAACVGVDPELFFPVASPGTEAGAGQTARALSFCTGCLVRTECLDEAVANGLRHGVWGGTTESERQAFARREPVMEAAS